MHKLSDSNMFRVEPREDYQEAFCKFLDSVGGDMYGFLDVCDENGWYDDDVFTVRPYYWGEDEDMIDLPNFVYKPTGLEIFWYKYPMRSAESNQDVSLYEFKKILRHCKRSYDERWR